MPLMPTPIKPAPWPAERRAHMEKLLTKEAAKVKRSIGAYTVMIVATFEDGEFLHMQDGGTSPMPLDEFYARMGKTRSTVVDINSTEADRE